MARLEQPKIILLSAGVIFCLAGVANAQGWRGIRPLHSTRDQVERLIGSPLKPNGTTYDLKNERVNVVYSDGNCVKGWPYGWNVTRGTVIGITVYPQTRPKLAELPLDLNKSKKYVDPSGFIHFTNDEEGWSVEIDPADHSVRVIEYFPAASDAALRCPDAAVRARELDSGESTVRAPDVFYSDSSPLKREVYLDQFADELRKSPSHSTVYIIGYGGQKAFVGEALERADLAKNYLIGEKGVDRKRIITVDGGYRDSATVELFIIPRGQPKPLPSPSIYPPRIQILEKPRG